MEQDESNNLAEAGTETVDTSADDNAINYDYLDPDEDNEEAAEPVATEDEGGEAEAEPESEDEESTEKPAAVAKFVLQDGREVTSDELVAGYQRQSDYTRKTQELGQRRQALDAEAHRLSNVTQAFVDHLTSLVPQAPSPSLAMQNPAQYTAMKAQHDAALAQVQTLVEHANKAKEVVSALTNEQRQARLVEENNRLMDAAPETRTKDGRDKFFGETLKTAKALGFTDQEFGNISDHRMLMALKMAATGMGAVEAQKVAKAKAKAVPPVTPKPKPGGATANARNDAAMRNFAKNPTLRNAAAAWNGD